MSQYTAAVAVLVFLGVISSFTALGGGEVFGIDADVDQPPPRQNIDISSDGNAIDDSSSYNVTYKTLTENGNTAEGWGLETDSNEGKITVQIPQDISQLSFKFENPRQDFFDGVNWGLTNSSEYSYPQSVGTSTAPIEASGLNQPGNLVITWNTTDVGFLESEEGMRGALLAEVYTGEFQQNLLDYARDTFNSLGQLSSSNPLVAAVIIIPIIFIVILLLAQILPLFG